MPTLHVPHHGDGLFDPLKTHVTPDELRSLAARYDENVRAIEDAVNGIVVPTGGGAATGHGWRLRLDGNQPINRNTETVPAWFVVDEDTDAFFTGSGIVTIPTGLGGRYWLYGTAAWQVDSNIESRRLWFYKNATLINPRGEAQATANVIQQMEHGVFVTLAEGDTCKMTVFTSSIANATRNLTSPNSSFQGFYLGA